MNYALIENNIVTNLIWLHPMNADEFLNAVPVEDLPVKIGDTYMDGIFYRDGKEVQNNPGGTSEQAFIDAIMQEVSSYEY